MAQLTGMDRIRALKAKKAAAAKPAPKPKAPLVDEPTPAAPVKVGKLAKAEKAVAAEEAAEPEARSRAETRDVPDETAKPAEAEKAAAEEAVPEEEPLVEPLDEPEILEAEDVAEEVPAPPPSFDEEEEPVAEPAMDESGMRAMLKEMFGDTLARLEKQVNDLSERVFGENHDPDDPDFMTEQLDEEGEPVLDGNDEPVMLRVSLVDAFAGELGDGVTYKDLGLEFDNNGDLVTLLDEEGNPVGSELATMLSGDGASVDLSGVETKVADVEADLKALKTRMLGNGSVLKFYTEDKVDDKGKPVLDGDGNPVKVPVPVVELLTFETALRSDVEPLVERADSIIDDNNFVTANGLVKMLLKPGELDVAMIQEFAKERGVNPTYEVMEALVDPGLMTEVAARVDKNLTLEDLDDSKNASVKESIDKKVEILVQRAAWCVQAKNIDWDALGKQVAQDKAEKEFFNGADLDGSESSAPNGGDE